MGRRKKLPEANKPILTFHKDLKMSTKLIKKSGRTVLVSFKDSTVRIDLFEDDGTIKTLEKTKYGFGDIALWRYCRAIKGYIQKGYAIDGTTSNFDVVLKEFKKAGKRDTNEPTDDEKL
jgi:hypothetical protein